MKKIPKNDFMYGYVIPGLNGKPYITRLLFPRFPWMGRFMLHRLHVADFDRDMHNHPWEWATTRILVGWYIENRKIPDGVSWHRRDRFDKAELNANTFHRISKVAPKTWTLFHAGERVQRWGFEKDGVFVDYEDYFNNRNHPYVGVKS
jgi:hypothetical protein